MSAYRQKKFVICDRDKYYLNVIQEYLIQKKLTDFEILTFDSMNELIAYGENEIIDILLLSESLCCDRVKDIEAVQIFILRENGKNILSQYPVISKYQSVNHILKLVIDEYVKHDTIQEISYNVNGKTSIYAYYSPQKSQGQTLAALTMGQLLSAMGKKVLYLNISAYSGFEKMLNTKYESDITDFMYFAGNLQQEHENKLMYKLDGMKYSINGLDYIAPALDFEDLLEISKENWIKGIEILCSASNYDIVIVELSEACRALYEILEMSHCIYTITDSQNSSFTKLTQYRDLLKKREKAEILEKTKFITLFDGWEKYDTAYESLNSTGMGKYMKGILKENGME